MKSRLLRKNRPYLEGYSKKPKNNYALDKLEEERKEVEDLIFAVKSQEFNNKENKDKLIKYLNKQHLLIIHRERIVGEIE